MYCLMLSMPTRKGNGLAGMQIGFKYTKSPTQNTKLVELKPAHLVRVPSSGVEVPVKCHRRPAENQPAPRSCAPEKPLVLGSCLQRLE